MASQFWNFPNAKMSDEDAKGQIGKPTQGWQAWFAQVTRLLFGLSESGTTVQRPTKDLYVGRMYFDTTRNQPLWLTATAPDVWIDASGSSQSGVTAARPTTEFYVGRQYFDTTLGQPIWWLTSDPDPEVWVDATGAPV